MCGVTLVAEIPRIGLPVGMASDLPHVWIEYDCRFSYCICMLACKNKLQWVMWCQWSVSSFIKRKLASYTETAKSWSTCNGPPTGDAASPFTIFTYLKRRSNSSSCHWPSSVFRLFISIITYNAVVDIPDLIYPLPHSIKCLNKRETRITNWNHYEHISIKWIHPKFLTYGLEVSTTTIL